MDLHAETDLWWPARAVAPPPQPTAWRDAYEQAMDDALANLDRVLSGRWEDSNPPGTPA